MHRTLVAIGYNDLHDDCPAELYDHDDFLSLDDADVVLFRVPIAPAAFDSYMGLPCLTDGDSFSYVKILDHWRSELQRAVFAGKTLFVELRQFQEVYVATGRTDYSGTGRNARATRIVHKVNNYSSLPFSLAELQTGYGTEMRLHPKGKLLSQYWKQFAERCAYVVRFTSQQYWMPLVTTKVETAIVAARFAFKEGGNVVLLPFLNLAEKPAAKHKELSTRFVHELLNIDLELRGQEDAAPPEWISQPQFATPRIQEMTNLSLRLQEELRQVSRRQEALEGGLTEAYLLQALVHAQSKKLERAILYALHLMGIIGENYSDGLSEFDAVLDVDGVRMLGEAEGKDNTAINIDKISQLERNVGEDFQREEVTDYAKGVLFGNPQRLTPPSERTLTFTDKCVASAERNHFALVLTASMFAPASYLESNEDPEYAAQCRAALLAADGTLVVFPAPPTSTIVQEIDTATSVDEEQTADSEAAPLTVASQ